MSVVRRAGDTLATADADLSSLSCKGISSRLNRALLGAEWGTRPGLGASRFGARSRVQAELCDARSLLLQCRRKGTVDVDAASGGGRPEGEVIRAVPDHGAGVDVSDPLRGMH
jgi:hypothetical protein